MWSDMPHVIILFTEILNDADIKDDDIRLNTLTKENNAVWCLVSFCSL